MLKLIFSIIAGIGSYKVIGLILGNIGISSFMIPLLGGFAIFIIIWRVLKKFMVKKDSDDDEEEDDSPKSEQAKKAYDEGMKVLSRIRNKTSLVKSNEAARKIQDICKVGIDIFEDIKKNPEDLRKIKTFTNYYLDSTEKIINQYVDLSNRKDITPDIQESLAKVEGLLDQIKVTFDKQLASLLENDLLNLDVELSVLKKTMKYEG